MGKTIPFAEYDNLWRAINAAGPQPMVPEPGWEEIVRRRREYFWSQYAISAPTVEAVYGVLDFAAGPILEVGARNGLWAYLMQLEHGPVRATDDVPWENPWTEIEQVFPVKATGHSHERALFMQWPGQWQTPALVAFPGERFIHVGEERDWPGWVKAGEIKIPQWHGFTDAVFLYKRR